MRKNSFKNKLLINKQRIRKVFIMKKMEIFEPAMCCETGLCGVGVDPELLRISTLFGTLTKNGIEVKRYNLNSYPQEFVTNTVINDLIMKDGVDSLPATVVDGEIVLTKRYPTNQEIGNLLGIMIIDTAVEEKSEGCCCGEDGCC